MKETRFKEETQTRNFRKAIEILKKHKHQKNKLIPILQEIQDEYLYLPQEVVSMVANAINSSVAEVYGVASFYTHFTMQPKGKYIIKVCDGTACHVKGSGKLVDSLHKKLNLDAKNNTTPDMMFTVETVSCLGACGLAPVMVVNEEVHGAMDDQKVDQLLQELRKREGSEHGSY